jgi:sterol 14-demethylase
MLFAGIFSTGIMTCWLPFFLYVNPEWKAKVMLEIQLILDRHAPSPEGDELLTARLARIPPQVLETEMPIFDACLRETIRLCMSGTFLRRALVDGIEVGGHGIEMGTFMAYPVADAHLNPEYYPDPLR